MDDAKLSTIREAFTTGKMSCGEIKKLMAQKLTELIVHHSAEKKKVTPDLVKEFYHYKPMVLRQPLAPTLTPLEERLYHVLDQLQISHMTRYHQPIMTMEQGAQIASTLEGLVCKNLLLQGANSVYYLYLSEISVRANLSELKKVLGEPKLKMAEKAAFQEILNLPEGCATVLALMLPHTKEIRVVLDVSVRKDQKVNFHPIRNDATVTITTYDMLKFLEEYHVKVITL